MIKTEHAGREITYAENEDVWRCWELDMEAVTLTALRTKINKWDADRRRLSNIPVLLPDRYGGHVDSAVAVLLDTDGKSVWVFVEGKKGRRGERTKRSFSSVVIDTPESRAAIERVTELYRRTRELEKEMEAAREAIPKATAEAFKALGEVPDLPAPRPRTRR